MTNLHLPALGLALALLAPALGADEPRADDKGPFLGVLFRPVVDASSPHPRGVVVTHILPDSPAARVGLRRNDILLKYDAEAIRDAAHLTDLIRRDKPDRKVKLLVQRGRTELTVEPTLTLGLALKPAPAWRKGGGSSADHERGVAKPVGPPAVSVCATPLEAGKMKVTIEYYAPTGQLQTVTCQGAAAEIARTVQKLPERERQLVRIALQKLRTLNSARPTENR
jgi:membrane-associated protease RseP (regulator of RpoE activity)